MASIMSPLKALEMEYLDFMNLLPGVNLPGVNLSPGTPYAPSSHPGPYLPGTAPGVGTPEAAAAMGGGGMPGGFNWDNALGNFATGANALGNIASAWNAFQSLALAKDAFKFQKKAFNEQLGDNRQTYNTAMENRARNKASTYNWGNDELERYVKENTLG